MAEPSPPLDASIDSPSNEAFFSPAYLERRRRALEQQGAPDLGEELDSKSPAGHAYAIRVSTRLTSDFRRQHRKGATDITPQDVIDVLNSAGVKKWVLMGLHGYLGYMPQPRATQDVDVMVPYSERQRATKAIARWPALVPRELSQVTRFGDPADPDAAGAPKAVVDVMLPWSPFQELILKEYVTIDPDTQHRLPTLEAALVSKYAAMSSRDSDRITKEYNAADFRRLVRANHARIRHADLHRLAALVWENEPQEIDRFVQIAVTDAAFPI